MIWMIDQVRYLIDSRNFYQRTQIIGVSGSWFRRCNSKLKIYSSTTARAWRDGVIENCTWVSNHSDSHWGMPAPWLPCIYYSACIAWRIACCILRHSSAFPFSIFVRATKLVVFDLIRRSPPLLFVCVCEEKATDTIYCFLQRTSPSLFALCSSLAKTDPLSRRKANLSAQEPRDMRLDPGFLARDPLETHTSIIFLGR